MSLKINHPKRGQIFDGDQFCDEGWDGEHCTHWHEGSDCCYCEGDGECDHPDEEGDPLE